MSPEASKPLRMVREANTSTSATIPEASKPLRTTINVLLDNEQWYEFRLLCMMRRTKPSQEITRFIQHELAQWKQKEANA